jgi:TonB family protein
MKKTITAFSMLLSCLNLCAQDAEIHYIDARFNRVESAEESHYTREVQFNSETQRYDVRVYYPGKELKMVGQYMDEALQLAEGEFSYYYRNGQLESQGMYSSGVKYGSWKRYEWDGSLKPEKHYTGTTVESVLEPVNRTEGASFIGGEEALFAYIREHIIYPEPALNQQIEGTVEIAFAINEQGYVTNVSTFKGVHYFLDKEAERVVRSMPPWKPASRNGEAQRSTFILPIPFRLPD